MNPGRTLVIATNVFREAIRDRVLYLIALFAIFMVMAIRLLPEIAATTEAKITRDVGLGAMTLLGLLVAVFIGTGLVNKEIEKRTVLVLLAKPISRTEFIVGKHLGLSAVLAVLVAVMTAIYMALLSFSQISYPVTSVLMSSIFLFLLLSLMTAVAIAFGVFTSSLLATLLTFTVFLMGSFSANLVALGAQSKNPSIETITRNLYLVLPDLSRLDLKNQAVYGLLPSTETLLLNALYAVLYIIVLLAIAILVFSRREF
ncbi:ABC-type transport system involved in multi-copper enzyme maturation, permease component [Leptolyngbyaceae cyanobacterium JSC-12]|nr:ABC-type transport system involved in multi-copper enzyme maturation, permease component [Leptolyngbyaceae cyanobacterium JSC-12]